LSDVVSAVDASIATIEPFNPTNTVEDEGSSARENGWAANEIGGATVEYVEEFRTDTEAVRASAMKTRFAVGSYAVATGRAPSVAEGSDVVPRSGFTGVRFLNIEDHE
jgi:hypothetical protein